MENKKIGCLHPSFVCIGAQKAGTTWLYDNLCRHPDVWLPQVKEIHFFNTVCPHEKLIGVETHNHLGPLEIWRLFFKSSSLKDLRWLKRFYYEPKTTQWYYDLFSVSPNDKCTGDITPAYSTLDEKGVSFARQVLPDKCKVFIILRNPIERLWSGLKMNYRWRGENVREISSASLLKEMRIASHYLRTDYSRTINLWHKYFPGDFKIFLFDDLIENSASFLTTIQDYIGVKRFVNKKTLDKKSNADRKKIEIPTEIQKFVLAEYAETINKLECVVPGIKERWLG
jgi:hypothetical protein